MCDSENCPSGKCPFGKLSVRGTVLRRTFRNCPSEKCLREIAQRGIVRRGILRKDLPPYHHFSPSVATTDVTSSSIIKMSWIYLSNYYQDEKQGTKTYNLGEVWKVSIKAKNRECEIWMCLLQFLVHVVITQSKACWKSDNLKVLKQWNPLIQFNRTSYKIFLKPFTISSS